MLLCHFIYLIVTISKLLVIAVQMDHLKDKMKRLTAVLSSRRSRRCCSSTELSFDDIIHVWISTERRGACSQRRE